MSDLNAPAVPVSTVDLGSVLDGVAEALRIMLAATECPADCAACTSPTSGTEAAPTMQTDPCIYEASGDAIEAVLLAVLSPDMAQQATARILVALERLGAIAPPTCR